MYQLDLKRRLFRHPVSYMIYSGLFEALPQQVKDRVYARLLAALKAPGKGRGFYPEVSPTEAAAMLDILVATKPDFRDFVQRGVHQ